MGIGITQGCSATESAVVLMEEKLLNRLLPLALVSPLTCGSCSSSSGDDHDDSYGGGWEG